MSTNADSTVTLIREMQWWVLRLAGEEVVWGDRGLPTPPPLSYEDRQLVSRWLWDCADVMGQQP